MVSKRLIKARDVRLKFSDSVLERATKDIAETVRALGGSAYVVGGSVRDHFFGLQAKDVDIEVYGIESERLEHIVTDLGFGTQFVGKNFGVFKINNLPIDISLPRTERKTGAGYKGFHIESNPVLDFETAASRRDYTINSMSLDPLSGDLIDPFDGLKDVEKRRLKHTSARILEDPLRVLRGMQFIARFELTADESTVKLLAENMPDQDELVRERVFDEWRKLLLLGRKISSGLQFLREVGWLKYYPELESMIDCKQDPRYHPEGDVWQHTLLCLDAFATMRYRDQLATKKENDLIDKFSRIESERNPEFVFGRNRFVRWIDRQDMIVGLAVLAHDMGKPATTERLEDGTIRSYGHDKEGSAISVRFLKRLTSEQRYLEMVPRLAMAHMRPMALVSAGAGISAYRRLARAVGRLDLLIKVCKADAMGRSNKQDDMTFFDKFIETVENLKLLETPPQMIVKGRHLIEKFGLAPGPHIGQILSILLEKQLDGEFEDLNEGLKTAQMLYSENPDLLIRK